MKKQLITTMLLILGLTAPSKAANTDFDQMANVVYIEPVSTNAGVQLQLSVKMNNAVYAQGFEFSLYLPDGISAVLNDQGEADVVISQERIEAQQESSIEGRQQADGSLYVFCTLTGKKGLGYFAGNEGEVAVITVDVSADLAEGEYPILLKGIAISRPDDTTPIEISQVESSVTITDGRLKFYETATTLPAYTAGEKADVTMYRTIKANEWSTIVLPFAMSEAQVKAAFGDDVQIGDFKGYKAEMDEHGNTVSISVSFTSTNAIEANHPYIIKVTEAIEEFTVDGVYINPEKDPKVATVKRTRSQWSEMIGTYVPTTIDNLMLFLSSNKFWYSIGLTKMKGFRAYFDFYDVLKEVEDNYSSRLMMSFEDETTGIRSIDNSQLRIDNYYDLKGMRVDDSQLKKGIYVKDGKKIVVK